ncbi:hypothetical protein [Flavobacterium psychraquaticum]|uniref:hypothetical protein n=1 Tax=Flavobacterium psychraquaticum TaxID=3103958 RepID=UPI002ACD7767|nr:hypothetical protein [Flavobacterium sp. LB-N7T]
MKSNSKLGLFIGTLVLVFMLVIPTDAFSQGPPPWAKGHSYKAKTRYVYFPDQNMYYDIQRKSYIYASNNNWEVRTQVPSVYVGINLGKSTQVELDFYGDAPQRYNTSHRTVYKTKVVYVDNHKDHHKHYKKQQKRRKEHHKKHHN